MHKVAKLDDWGKVTDMNVTKRLENTVRALQENQLKKALYLTEHEKTSRQHEWVEEAARKCLANKNDKKTCQVAIKETRERIADTITPPMEDTSLEGLEEYLSSEPNKPAQANDGAQQPEPELPQQGCHQTG